MELTIKEVNDCLCIGIQNKRLDAAHAVQFKDQVRRAIDGFEGRVVLDFKNVTFLDSSGLGALVAVMKIIPAGRKLEIASPNDIVRKVFALTKMDNIFILHDSLHEAYRVTAA